MNFVPALAYHFCLNLSAAFTQPGARLLVEPCKCGLTLYSSTPARFGVLGFGLYPLGLELAVEAIFPLDESAGTIFIFLFGQISALLVISLKGPLAQNLTEEDANIQVSFKEHKNVDACSETMFLCYSLDLLES